MFERGQVYQRADIHAQVGGQSRTRISTPTAHNIILLFSTDHQTEFDDLRSGWTRYGIYRFVGEGRLGHMLFTRGNLAVRQHRTEGKTLHLFISINDNPATVRYEGQFMYSGHFYKEGLDAHRQTRRMIVFILKPLG